MTVSVVMTCHNHERYIEQAVRSVTAQTDFARVTEIVVVNDGSGDGSQRVLERLAGEIEQLRVLETAGLGLPAARNRALQEGAGEFVAFLDGDDYWTPEKLARQLPAFGQGPKIGLVYGDFLDFTRDDAADAKVVTVRSFTPETRQTLRDYFVHDAPIVPSTTIVRRAVFEDVGLFDESLRRGFDDTEFFLRVAEKWQFSYVPGAFLFKRRRPGQMTHRLAALLPDAVRVTESVCARHPELSALAHRRLARFYCKATADCALKGEWRNGARYGATAIRLAPSYWRAWLNLTLLLAPASVVRPCYQAVKRPWHELRQARHEA